MNSLKRFFPVMWNVLIKFAIIFILNIFFILLPYSFHRIESLFLELRHGFSVFYLFTVLILRFLLSLDGHYNRIRNIIGIFFYDFSDLPFISVIFVIFIKVKDYFRSSFSSVRFINRELFFSVGFPPNCRLIWSGSFRIDHDLIRYYESGIKSYSELSDQLISVGIFIGWLQVF